MDFEYSQEEEDFNSYVGEVINEQINPEHPRWRTEKTTPPRFFEILGDAGLLGFRVHDNEVVPIPWLLNIHYYKQMAQYSGGLAIASFANSQLGLQALQYFADDSQKTAYLIPGVRGKSIFAFANTEPGAGSDASAITMKAEDQGDHFLVNGAKAYITNGDIADHIIFTAVTHPEEGKQHRRISMFVVDGDALGLSRSRLKKLGWKLSHLSMLRFNDVRISKDALIGEEKRGFYQTMQVFNTGRIGISALAFGTSLGAYRMAYDHAKTRRAFGKLLIDHESKRNEFAVNIVKLQAGWLLVQKAAFLKDRGREFRFNSAMAKLFCTEEGLEISQWATEIFGARGVIESLPVSQYPLDAKAATLGEGAPEVQKKIIAENIPQLLENL